MGNKSFLPNKFSNIYNQILAPVLKYRWLGYIMALGALLRFLGLFDNLWLDEVWSWMMVSKLNSPWEIVTRLHHDNNHILNSFFMYLVGNHDPGYWFKFRLLSFLLGALSIPAAYLVVSRLYAEEYWRLATALFVAFSFPLVAYSCEARGYSSVVFFSLVSFYLLTEFFRKEGFRVFLFLQCSLLLGIISHFSFFYIGAGLFILSISRVAKQPSSLAQKTIAILKLFIIPAIAGFALFFGFFSNLVYGGGSGRSKLEVFNETMSYLAGYPEYSSLALSVFIFLTLVCAVYFLVKKGQELGVFCFSCICVVFALLLFKQPSVLIFRYFLCIFPFLIILLVYSLYLAARKFPKSRMIILACIVLIIFGNVRNIGSFLKEGRGDYSGAVKYMYDNTSSAQMTVSSDHDFRNSMLLYFYAPFYLQNKSLVYIPRGEAASKAPEWFIKHSFARDAAAPPYIILGNGLRYKLERRYLYSGLISGFNWFLYHRESRAGPGDSSAFLK